MTEELNQQTNSPQTKPFDGTSLKQDGQNASLSDGGKDKTADILKEHDKEYFEMFEGCEKYLGSYMDYPKEFENCSDKIIKENAYNVDILCGDKEFCDICKAKISEAKRQKKRQIEFLESLGLVKIKKQEPIEFETIYNNDTFDLVNKEIKILKKEVERE